MVDLNWFSNPQRLVKSASRFISQVDMDFWKFVKQNKDVEIKDKMYANRLSVYWDEIKKGIEKKEIDYQMYNDMGNKYNQYSKLMSRYGVEYAKYMLNDSGMRSEDLLK